MALLSRDTTHCPPPDQLAGLIQNDLSTDKQAALAEHVGGCTGCQRKLDALATTGDPALSEVVRHIDRDDPPHDSAFWKALSNAEHALTAAYPGESATPSDLKLDFLKPSDTPGAIGRLGRFDILRVIGRGGMGVVLRATDPDLSRDVAIKILDPQLSSNDLARQRFCREARAAAAVPHDNLVAVYQVDEDADSGLPYLVMQLVIGESLEQRLKRVGRLSPAEVVKLGAQAAAGLAGAHARGLIHRDIKPGNILIEAGTEKVRLTRTSRSPAPGSWPAPRCTWPRSRPAGTRWTTGPTCSAWAACCTRRWPASRRSTARPPWPSSAGCPTRPTPGCGG